LNLHVAKLHFFKSAETERYTYTEYSPNGAAIAKLLSEAKAQ
jgi:hypothetical protein